MTQMIEMMKKAMKMEEDQGLRTLMTQILLLQAILTLTWLPKQLIATFLSSDWFKVFDKYETYSFNLNLTLLF